MLWSGTCRAWAGLWGTDPRRPFLLLLPFLPLHLAFLWACGREGRTAEKVAWHVSGGIDA